MALWQITSYQSAVNTALQLRHTVTLLRVRFGRRWRREAPADLVWMLRTGIGVPEACARVRALVEVDGVAGAAVVESSRNDSDAYRNSPGYSEAPASAINSSMAASRVPRSGGAKIDGDRFTEAIQLNRRHWIEAGRPISAESLRQILHISAEASRELSRAVRAADQAAVIAAGAQA